ncbi:MAG TPA: hypothetical protein VN939_24165 [Chthoniobacterales bacterium]|nr:hypothetical protein [Chthoniobacterales bacterium]
MAFFKISYEVEILICVFAILIGSQIWQFMSNTGWAARSDDTVKNH